jgi:aerobic carbon-monoxide dehydrogenase large subunit
MTADTPGPGNNRNLPRVVGTKAKRIEDRALLRGRGRFLDDIRVDGALHAAFVRSQHAHARLRGVDVSAARDAPGVVAVFDAQAMRSELTDLRMPLGFPSSTLPEGITPFVLSDREVCFVGEAVAMVIATDRYLAEDAVALIQIDYEPLLPVTDCKSAFENAEPRVRGDSPNIIETVQLAYGDIAAAFGPARRQFKESLFIHRGVAHPIEGRGVLARFDEASNELTVWSSTQMSHELRQMLSDVLGMELDRLRVIAPDVGGGFGAKYVVYPEEIAVAAAARSLRRPVKWVEDRMEHFLSAIQDRDQYWDVEIAVDDAGKIQGIRGRMIHDQGAYTPQGVNLPYNSVSSLTGPYVVPAYQMSLFVCQTNKPSVIPVRGAGYPQAAFVMERLMDRIARELQIDRVEVRNRNLIPKEKMPYNKQLRSRAGVIAVVDSGDYAACTRKAVDAIDYAGFALRQTQARADGRHIGLGFAHAVKPTGRGPFESAVVRVTPGGRVGIYTGAMAMGQGLATALAQLCAEQLGVPLESIDVSTGDTSRVSLGLGGFASRQAILAGSAVHLASLEVRHKAIKVAQQVLEVAEQDLVLQNGRVEVLGVPGHGVSLATIARKLKGSPGYALPRGVTPGLEATSLFQFDAQAFANATHACEVEVDIGTGDVRILRYVAVHDSGRLINPMIAEGQIHGGIVHGIGNALFEKMRFNEIGQPLTTTFADYLLPTATEIPDMEVLFHESPSPTNPLGVKGIGETGTIPVSACVISAVENALATFNVRIREAPLSPIRILEMIDEGRGQSVTA